MKLTTSEENKIMDYIITGNFFSEFVFVKKFSFDKIINCNNVYNINLEKLYNLHNQKKDLTYSIYNSKVMAFGKDYDKFKEISKGNTLSVKLDLNELKRYAYYRFSMYQKVSKKIYYVKKSENDNSIIIYNINVVLEAGMHEKPMDCLQVNILKKIIITLGEPISVITKSNTSKKQYSLLEALSLKLSSIKSDEGSDLHCVFENNDIFDFLFENQKFSKYSGLIDCFSLSHYKYNQNSLFLYYLYLYTEFPVVELLMKMGCSELIFNIIDDINSYGTKSALKERMDKFRNLFNNTSKGANAIKLPKVIADFLKNKSASLDEYNFWCDIYDLEKLQKEGFDEIINSKMYLIVNMEQCYINLANVVKHGYPLNKVILYASKELNEYQHFNKIREVLYMWADYLDMCDIMNVEYADYPQNIKKIHDEMNKSFVIYKDKEKEEQIATLYQEVEEYVIPKINAYDEKLKKENPYMIVFPHSIGDFIDEGNSQNNCVGRYFDRVVEKEICVFFIREKSNPEKSFITAECSFNGRLGQVMLKNNVFVEEHHPARSFIKRCTENIADANIKKNMDNPKIAV